MKRWAVVTVALYLLALVGLTAPVLIDCYSWGPENTRIDPSEAGELFHEWGYWVWIGVSLLGQILLLIVPVDITKGRPQRRRRLLVPVITSAFLMGVVCVSAIAALVVGFLADDGLKMFEVLGRNSGQILATLGIYLVLSWTAWALVFRRFLNNTDPDSLIRRLMRWLLTGSILELLVAVPCHVIVRQRHDCCAPYATFWGIATGLTVMLISYGPGVYFLFVKRTRDRRPKTPAA